MSDYPRAQSVCFTGHRPAKLPVNFPRGMLYSMLYAEICAAVSDGFTVFYTGIAPGIDLLAGAAVAELKQTDPRLRLICASPYPAFCSGSYHNREKPLLEQVLAASDETVNVCRHFTNGCFRLRNRYMVDHSARLIGVMTCPQSGSAQTIRMASESGLDLRVLDLTAAEPAIK